MVGHRHRRISGGVSTTNTPEGGGHSRGIEIGVGGRSRSTAWASATEAYLPGTSVIVGVPVFVLAFNPGSLTIPANA